MDSNRIGATCWFFRFDSDTKVWQDWKPGKLRAWSMDHDENDGQYVPFPVGVVESDETGLCHSVYVERICFADSPPTQPGAVNA